MSTKVHNKQDRSPRQGSHRMGLDALVADADGYVNYLGDRWFQVKDAQAMPEFFTMPASSSDHWMFVSSGGAITAGRRNPNNALFPYYSCDKLLDTAHSSGSLTVVRVADANGQSQLWVPFERGLAQTALARNLYKNVAGNKILFEEQNAELGLVFRYQWSFGDKFGFVRSCQLASLDSTQRQISILDGLQNVLAAGVTQEFQLRYSNLADAYKKHELLPETNLGLFYLSSIPSDEALPSEGLKATTVWARGLPEAQVLLSKKQLEEFVATGVVEQETDRRGTRGAFLLASSFELSAYESIQWDVVAELEQDHSDVIRLNRVLSETSDEKLRQMLVDDVVDGQNQLDQIVGAADGIQSGADQRVCHRHRSNVTYNVMRGGLPSDNYVVSIRDFVDYLAARNQPVYNEFKDAINSLGESISQSQLHGELADLGNRDLLRLGKEYLPFTFGRRHGDPSRPWNKFSIETKCADGSRKIAYEGNWRDIFQNWEAIAFSWPGFTNCMIRKFVNASSADGYNPYRITHLGVEWEEPSEDEFSNIGYWGDHQIIYLTKLLEWSYATDHLAADKMLLDQNCSYVNIPYRIANYNQMLLDSSNTITFDAKLNKEIRGRVEAFGTDAKLHCDSAGSVRHVGMLEKLLLPAMVKMTNFVPGGGIWLNTQRPEWNDANNALVGRGVSVVTACYLHRFFLFLKDWFVEFQKRQPDQQFAISSSVWSLTEDVKAVFANAKCDFSRPLSDQQRKTMIDALSAAGDTYRTQLYRDGVSADQANVQLSDCVEVIDFCLAALRSCIAEGHRPDGLYDAYKLLHLDNDSAALERLDEMLEGQVAAISSNALSTEACCQILDRLQTSRLYREDQGSYLLYPDRSLSRFMDKNCVDASELENSKLLQSLVASDDRSIVRMNLEGSLNFCGDFKNACDLNQALDQLAETKDEFRQLIAEERYQVDQLFEKTFQHHKFTGRSGTFFAYEGLGSIYWHMVSKLGLAVIERYIFESDQDQPDASLLSRISDHYAAIRDGLGVEKTPANYGAFPIDPYSHTPEKAGAKQPGMTGQVKEDVLCRLLELGVRVRNGKVYFEPSLFETDRFTTCETTFNYPGQNGQTNRELLRPGFFGWTWCQTPIVYRQSDVTSLELVLASGEIVNREALDLTEQESQDLFARTGNIKRITINLSSSSLRSGGH